MLWVRAFHLIGMVLWFGSTLQVSRMLKTHATAPAESHATLTGIERRTQMFIGFPGLAITLITGLIMLLEQPMVFLAVPNARWFHPKLTFVVGMLVIETLLFFEIRRFAKAPGKKLRPLLLHILAGLSLIAILVFVKVVGGR